MIRRLIPESKNESISKISHSKSRIPGNPTYHLSAVDYINHEYTL